MRRRARLLPAIIAVAATVAAVAATVAAAVAEIETGHRRGKVGTTTQLRGRGVHVPATTGTIGNVAGRRGLELGKVGGLLRVGRCRNRTLVQATGSTTGCPATAAAAAAAAAVVVVATRAASGAVAAGFGLGGGLVAAQQLLVVKELLLLLDHDLLLPHLVLQHLVLNTIMGGGNQYDRGKRRGGVIALGNITPQKFEKAGA